MLDSRSRPGLTERKLCARVMFVGFDPAGGGGGGDGLATEMPGADGQLRPRLTTLGDLGGGDGRFPLTVLWPDVDDKDDVDGGPDGGVGLIGLWSGTGGLGAKLGLPKFNGVGLPGADPADPARPADALSGESYRNV